MNAKQQTFIRKELIPFILREQGRGFAMDIWEIKGIPNCQMMVDNMTRTIPSCGTVACIGGSTRILATRLGVGGQLAKILGLSDKRVSTLFFGPEKWPEPSKTKYARAKTTLGKAKVAAALLEEVARTRGRCLDQKENQR